MASMNHLQAVLRTMTGAVAVALLVAAPADAKVDFKSRVLPILESRCFDCHRATYVDSRGRTKRPKAGLRLDGKHWILAGSADGRVLFPGKPEQSSLYALTVLPKDDADIMPAKGEPLTKAQAETLRKWIAEGADFGKWIGEPGPTNEDKTADATGAPDLEGGDTDLPQRYRFLAALGRGLQAAPDEAIEAARRAGATVAPVIPGSPLLRVSFISNETTTGDASLRALAPLAGHITELDLARTRITDGALDAVSQMSRLSRLGLRGTSVSDSGIAKLAGLTELRHLNLFGTAATDACMVTLGRLSQLQAVYLWKTRVTEAGADALRSLLPDTKIILAPELPAPESPADDENPARRRR